MAVIICPKCYDQISSKDVLCPNCGYKIKKNINILVISFILFIFTMAFIIPDFKPKYKVNKTNKTKETIISNIVYELPIIDVAPNLSEEQLKISLSHLRKNTDDIEDITWYFHQNTPKYANSHTNIAVYFGCRGERPSMPRLRINYVSSSWLFIYSYVIKVDEELFCILPNEINRDNGTLINGKIGIWERCDNDINKYEMEMILAIIKSKKTVIRFKGNKYHHDYTVSKSEKLALKEILAAWKYLGGEFK